MTSPLPGTTLSESEQAALVYTLSDCFVRRPTLESVAPGLVRDMLEAEYPSLGERLAHAALIHPVSNQNEDSTVEYGILPLTNLLIGRFLGEKAELHPADSYLTLYPGAEHPQKLSLDTVKVEALLSEWAPLLPEAYKQALVDFWSSPFDQEVAPWQRLSDFFAVQLRQACVALSGEERDTVQAVLDYPDPQVRRGALGNHCTQVDIPILDTGIMGSDLRHFQALVMSRWIGERQIVLLYTLFGGIEAFDSRRALEESLLATLSSQYSGFRNYTPDDHVFDALAVSLLKLQLEAIAAIKPSDYRDGVTLGQRLHELTGLQALFGAFRSGHEARLGRLHDLLPEWLRRASLANRTLYGLHVASLSAVHRQHAGQAFLDGIPDIHSFAGESLRESLQKKHPEAAAVSVADIRVTLTPIVSRPLIMGDSIMPIGFRGEPRTQDYVAMALRNLKAFPLSGDAQVHYKDRATPAWMTYEVLRTAVSDADIGGAYPELLRQKLQRDLIERTRQERLFTDYLRVLLPMLALELQLEGKLTETARRYVEAVITQDAGVREVHGQHIVARPLAFLAYPDATANRVRNMFVIGPRATVEGPQVLFRPGADQPLREFASLAGLLTAIKTEQALRQSVLDGLDATTRPIYDYGGFEEPHLPRAIFSDFDILPTPAPVSLDTTPLSGSFGAALFAASVEALVAHAEADSVSDAEERWERFADLGWTLFGVLQPFVPTSLASAGLIVQLVSSLKTFTDPNAAHPWAAFADVLLNLAVVLVYHRPLLTGAAVTVPRIVDNAVYKEPVVRITHQLVVASIRMGPHLSVSRLVRLEEFKLSLSESPGTLLTEGEWQGLYQRDERFYACIDGAWFRVSRKLEGVVIINDGHPSLQGPWLKRDDSGAWQPERGLRLLGGAGELSVRATKKLKSLEKKARDLLATLPRLLAEGKRSASTVSTPRSIQDILVIKAQPFEEAIRDFRGLTQGLAQSPRWLIAELEEAANTLTELGLSLRISLTKQGLPNAAAIEFLMENEQITIRKLGTRRDISGGKGSDFLEEYGIRDKEGHPLWFAHFHYRTATTPAPDFSKAHLKTRAQRYMGLNFQIAQETAGQKVVPIWRGPIDARTAAAFFLR
ncbi:dermonecrotic toxin domain-containing protein [Pseudomonas agarici]|uniref:dermonecrotic toxin domain-containing protein n=1 Tax=Pseudomonas agarici TaxID=46677 RepID=UPI00030721E9|nr:DUF6543 domain-containing protein [Pseudomonas agarici]NWB90393.1 hypothetical protein [Pseudomonas agarici]NWC08708.1 hypothetical protein [Pseudomonas agarici]SEK55369.1 hypothetical protein SAMN05216604_10430 [Pseudomonas agarici]